MNMPQPEPITDEDRERALQTEEAVQPRGWRDLGILIALQPFSWMFGIVRNECSMAIDFGPIRITAQWP